MAIGVEKTNTRVGIELEVTEGTAVDPSAATSFIQPLEDGLEITPAKELVERTILTTGIGQATPRTGLQSVSGSIPTEFRASGTEGEEPDFDALFQSLLGTRNQRTAAITTKASIGTVNTAPIEDADIADFALDDVVLFEIAGGFHPAHVTAIDPSGGAAFITFFPDASAPIPASTVISKSTTYVPSDSGQPTFTTSVYWGNEIKEQASGCRTSSMSLDNFTTGQIASFNFAFEGLGSARTDAAAPFTPTFDSGVPPLILSAKVFQDSVCIDVNEVGLSVENTISFLTSVKDEDGRISSRFTDRVVSGTLNPYLDDTTLTNWTNFDTNTEFKLLLQVFNPDATDVVEKGSLVSIFLPQCILTENSVTDLDGILTESLSFQATGGSSGSLTDIAIGFV